MKKYLWISSCFLIAAVTLMGCGPSKNQLLAEQSFYAAKAAQTKATGSQPIFRMTAGDPTQPIILQNVSALEVFQLPANGGNDDFRQYQHIDYAAKWVNLLGTTVSVAAPWLGVWGVVHEVAGMAGTGGTTYNQSVTGKGNSAQLRTVGNVTTGDISHSTVGGVIDQTSQPTVVDPVVVIVPPAEPIVIEPSYPPIVPVVVP